MNVSKAKGAVATKSAPKLRFVLSSRVNSHNGCKTCKTRKKKCDETKPICRYCRVKGLECEYRPRKKPTPGPTRPKPPLNSSSQTEIAVKASQTDIVKAQKTETVSLGNPLIVSPSSIPFQLLNQNSFYIDHFYHQVSTSITISIDGKNYFRDLYCKLAMNEQAFTSLIAAWSSMSYKRLPCEQVFGTDPEVRGYFQKAVGRFNRYFKAKNNRLDYYFQIVFYIALTELILNYGGTEIWRTYFKKACDLVVEYGGLERFCADLWYNNDTRFIVSSIQHIDILSSTALAEGTIFSIEEYRRVFVSFRNNQSCVSYGVDPLQGCQQNLVLILGDIMNHKVMIEQTQLELELVSQEEYPSRRAAHLKFIELAAHQLQAQLDGSSPDLSAFPPELAEEMVLPHKNLFQLLIICCQIYLELYIKRVAPNNYKVQGLVREMFVLFDELLYTKMCLILVFPLVVCGTCVFLEQDKLRLTRFMEKLAKRSAIRNVEKTWRVVLRAWEVNPDGNTIVDWSGICEEFGWELNIC